VRVLLVSDLHYDLRKLDWVMARVSDPSDAIDVVVLAGDLLDIASSLPLDAQITVVLSYLERLAARLPTVVCSGNHDLDTRTDSGEKATRWLAEARAYGVVVDGDSLDVGDWRVTACAWWEGPETLAVLEERLAAAASDRPDNWAWAFHGPPEGPLSWTGSRHYGDPELPRLLDTYSPDVVLCGHIHQAPFTPEGAWSEQRGTTWLFNAGYQRGDQPSFIELDLEDRRASWFSASEQGTVELAQ
jgi:predicted MPP superfamily phosphohydrolase